MPLSEAGAETPLPVPVGLIVKFRRKVFLFSLYGKGSTNVAPMFLNAPERIYHPFN
jgi:hypothetical protein